MSTRIPFLEPDIQDTNVIRKLLPERGHGLISTRDIPPRGQLLFVRQTSLLALDNKRLEDSCYQCFRSTSDRNAFFLNDTQSVNLKVCTGCKTVKFCDPTCLKLAWNRYHKHECKIYGKLHPRVLPTSTRAILRLLLQRKDGSLPNSEWEQLFTLESHRDQISKSDSTKYFDLCLMAKAIHAYSGTSESVQTVEQLFFVLTINSFTLTNPVLEPLGVILHPLPALINHSCNPNAYVRFDIPPPGTTPTHLSRLPNSSISIHALSPIPKDTEITISYIDATLPSATRQTELSSQYFFTCSCPLCKEGPNALTDALPPSPPNSQPDLPISESLAAATTTLHSLISPSSLPPHDQITRITHALSLTHKSPPHRYPLPHLLTHLIQLYISTSAFLSALAYARLKSHRVDTTLYPSPHHPIRLTGLWLVYRLARHSLIQHFEDNPSLESHWDQLPRGGEEKILAGMMCAALASLAETLSLSLPGPRRGESGSTNIPSKELQVQVQPPPYIGPETPPSGAEALPEYAETPPLPTGAFEAMVLRALEETVSGDGAMFWRDYEAGRLPGEGDFGKWVDGIVGEVVDDEAENEKGEK